jgi:site-specific recombinase XerC
VITLDKLRPSDIEALLTAKRAAGLSDSTVRLIYTVCRAVLDTAVRDQLVRRNVAAVVKRPTIKRSEAKYLSALDVGASSRQPRVTGWSLSLC